VKIGDLSYDNAGIIPGKRHETANRRQARGGGQWRRNPAGLQSKPKRKYNYKFAAHPRAGRTLTFIEERATSSRLPRNFEMPHV
jgi:hypothetical protein